jgi:hypothetical protein
MIRYDMIYDDMIYLTAVGLTPMSIFIEEPTNAYN